MPETTSAFELGFPGPPRLTGDQARDMPALVNWMYSFFTTAIMQAGLARTPIGASGPATTISSSSGAGGSAPGTPLPGTPESSPYGGYAGYFIIVAADESGLTFFDGSTLLRTTDIGSLVEAYDANIAKLNVLQAWTKPQRGTPVALTSSGASIAIDLSLANNFTHTTSENTTLAAPSNPVAGQAGVIVITQGAAAKTLGYNSFWKFPSGTVPTLTASVGAVDVLSYYVESASRATCVMLNDVK